MASCISCFSAMTSSLESLLTRASAHTETRPKVALPAEPTLPAPVGLLRSYKERSTTATKTPSSQPQTAESREDHTKALQEALQQQDVAAALYSIKHGANTTLRYGARRNTALHLAAFMKDPVLMRRLVMSVQHDRRFLDQQNCQGETALMACAVVGDVELCRILIMAKCDVNIQDVNGWSCLDHAEAIGNPEIVQALKAAGARGLGHVWSFNFWPRAAW